jgi:hypothetical protein
MVQILCETKKVNSRNQCEKRASVRRAQIAIAASKRGDMQALLVRCTNVGLAFGVIRSTLDAQRPT